MVLSGGWREGGGGRHLFMVLSGGGACGGGEPGHQGAAHGGEDAGGRAGLLRKGSNQTVKQKKKWSNQMVKTKGSDRMVRSKNQVKRSKRRFGQTFDLVKSNGPLRKCQRERS